MLNLHLLYPEIGLAVFALVLLTADLFFKGGKGKFLYFLGVFSACLTLGILGLAYSSPETYQGLGTMWTVDPLALFFKVLILATVILVLLLSVEYKPEAAHGHLGSFSALVLLSAVGMMLLVSAVDLLLIFLALELVSISSFILVGYERKDLRSSEGAMKYFIIGAFSSALMVYGISLFYGSMGTTRLTEIYPLFAQRSSAMFILGCLLILVGFGFKISMAPFHLWVADAYEGAPTPVTAFLSVAPKIAGMAVLLRVFTHFVPLASLDLSHVLCFLAMLTMTVGNCTAIFQTNVKRLLAYSSIAQAGYMLIGFVTGGILGREGVLLYSLVYLFMNLGIFAVVIHLGNEDGYELDAFDGLAKRDLALALLSTFFLLSLAGIPPLAGFIAKFRLFQSAIQGGWYWLAVVGVLNSVISVYYYMSIAHHMFFREPRRAEPARRGWIVTGTVALATAAIFLFGLYPEPALSTVRLSAEILPARAAGAARAAAPSTGPALLP
ncbi:MAG: NADH-quinone oxidoreductase subunit N [Elusimicrobia bacterium CG_4_9_14_3_um_filter_62_55]|nr:MAG: NADH-quinone oxidoreductase subunit N [Elusimicrobia bacterium CG22_combo_CG10-13_8_21_14_all_63_91]PJA17599.1 MAG: NADH-quinone oxidoreductase subunit N [Elusimicrobia bacterium CG_4_10_14_0_2_um_filter_63_34]PJB26558.1 MAG: NADH-quinone oxidoreductase subunit N [Elusimicrobia bacterium CG_4_9_14_3_um_filter_62_55]